MAIRSKFKWWEQCALSQGLAVTLLTVSVFQKKGNQRTHRTLRSQGHRAAGSLRVSEATSVTHGLTRAVPFTTKTNKQVFHTFIGAGTQQGEGQTHVGNSAAHGTQAD